MVMDIALSEKIDFSIIIPVYNEEGNVANLYREIFSVLDKSPYTFEVIFVDDGSTDQTLHCLRMLGGIKVIVFRKNFGQTAALDAGIRASRGAIIVPMDGDCQNDPADIPLLLEKIQEGFDVVSGWRWQRKDSPFKKFISLGARFLRRYFINDGIHDSGCTLKAYRRKCFDNVELHGEIHRFVPGILKWQGFRIGEMKVNHRPRVAGQTKYKLSRVLKGFMDMLSVWFWRKYAARPIHLFGGMGFVIGFLGTTLVVGLFFLRILGYLSLQNSIWPMVGFFMMLVGLQLLVSGLLADVSLKNYYHMHKTTPYHIKEVVENVDKKREVIVPAVEITIKPN